MPTLSDAVCPSCASLLRKDNTGCPECGYEDNVEGRILTLGEMLAQPSFPDKGAARYNDVSPAFLQALVDAHTDTLSAEPETLAWLVEFEDGNGELWPASDFSGQPPLGRWITPLVAGGPSVDQSPDEDEQPAPSHASIEEMAMVRWNSEADDYNQWDALGQDEKDALIAAEKVRVAKRKR